MRIKLNFSRQLLKFQNCTWKVRKVKNYNIFKVKKMHFMK